MASEKDVTKRAAEYMPKHGEHDFTELDSLLSIHIGTMIANDPVSSCVGPKQIAQALRLIIHAIDAQERAESELRQETGN